MFSVAPNLLTEVEGQHPAQDEEPGTVVREREGGVEGMLEDLWGRRQVEQEEAAEEEVQLRMRRAMLVREEELMRIREAERLHLRDEALVREQEVEEMIPEIPLEQPAAEEVEDDIRVRYGVNGRLRANLQAGQHPLGPGLERLPPRVQGRIQAARAGGGGVQPAGAPAARLDGAEAIGVGAEAAPAAVAVAPAVGAAAAEGVGLAEVNRRVVDPGEAAVAVAADLQEERHERRLRMMR